MRFALAFTAVMILSVLFPDVKIPNVQFVAFVMCVFLAMDIYELVKGK
jgi:hypothetical protein